MEFKCYRWSCGAQGMEDDDGDRTSTTESLDSYDRRLALRDLDRIAREETDKTDAGVANCASSNEGMAHEPRTLGTFAVLPEQDHLCASHPYPHLCCLKCS